MQYHVNDQQNAGTAFGEMNCGITRGIRNTIGQGPKGLWLTRMFPGMMDMGFLK
jgi:hypothetical protein